MKEELLQKKIVEVILSNQLLNFISNSAELDAALLMDKDDYFIPDFSIDYLLKKRFSEAGKRVLNGLSDYELVSGETIKNLSLQKGELLYPDLVLFNSVLNQIILVENKTSEKTEREAITELLGYATEIRNHLPFISNYDIHYILISSEFNTLLNHSVASQLLSDHINFLCLKPIVEEDEIVSLSVHFPDAWTDVGQTGIPPNGFVSYTICLYSKEEEGFALPDSFDFQGVVNVAVDLINHQANNYKSNGFLIAWVNGLDENDGECKAAISIYMLNPYVFLPAAIEKGFSLNKNSTLYQYLVKKKSENDGVVFPSSLFEMGHKAKEYLSQYFDVYWERPTDWISDTKDMLYAMQRLPVIFKSFGVIGDFIRNFYLHPATRRFLFMDEELHNWGYNKSGIGLQIINYISNNIIFKLGSFYCKDLFYFGKRLRFHLDAQVNAKTGDDSKPNSQEAFLFWTSLPLMQAMKEIQLRLRDAKNITVKDALLPIVLMKEGVKDDFEERFTKFIQWFKSEFINDKVNALMGDVFILGFNYANYFDPFLKHLYSKKDIKNIQKELGFFSRVIIGKIATEVLDRNYIDPVLQKTLNEVYFEGKLANLTTSKIDTYLRKASNHFFSEKFEDSLLDILNKVNGEIAHDLHDYEFSNSVDWKWLYESAIKRWNEGQRLTAIIVASNGELGLGKIQESIGMVLQSPSEIFIDSNVQYSGVSTIIKVKWESLLNKTFKFSSLFNLPAEEV